MSLDIEEIIISLSGLHSFRNSLWFEQVVALNDTGFDQVIGGVLDGVLDRKEIVTNDEICRMHIMANVFERVSLEDNGGVYKQLQIWYWTLQGPRL